jgi:hypothetical protein
MRLPKHGKGSTRPAQHRGHGARGKSRRSHSELARARSALTARHYAKAVLFIALMVFAAALIYTLSLTGPTWSPATPFTNNSLNCSWANSSDTLAQNITILRNGVLFNWTFQNASDGPLANNKTIDPANTTKGDIWTCRIMLYNETATTSAEVNITVSNTPPTTEGSPAGIFNSTSDVGYLVQIEEDSTLFLDVNATDADSDTLTYLNADLFCTRTSAAAGTYTCAPAQSDLTSNLPTQHNITFTASDGQNVGGRTITFNVTPANDAPTLTLANQNTAVNQSLNYTFTVSDEESNTPYSFILTAPSEISGKVSLQRLNAAGSSMSFYYDGASPDFNDVGFWNISINVTDNSTAPGGANNSRSAAFNFTLNISAVGRKPYFTLVTSNVSNSSGPYNITQGQPIQINVSVNDLDANTAFIFLDDTTRFNIVAIKSNNTGSDGLAQIDFTPTNGDVGIYNVTITVQDNESLANTTLLRFNVTNVNDAPTINEFSYSPSNTQNNQNASNLTAFANTLFTYDVNATDPDTLHGESFTFADNTSLFAINPTTGRITFTPTDSDVSPSQYFINITVTDSGSLAASRIIAITIRDNSPPRFSPPLPTLRCTTKQNCTVDLSAFVTDPDAGDSVVNYNITLNTTLGSFNYSNSTGLVNFTTAKADFGNYTLNVTIQDTHGARNSSLMSLIINNTPEAPNLTRYNFSDQTIVANHAFTYELQATDEDYLIAIGENVSFSTNLSGATIAPLAASNTTGRALFSFTPTSGQAGNHTIQINATDVFGLVSSKTLRFEVYPAVPAPNITNITPWGLPPLYTLQSTWNSTSETQFLDSVADLNTTENTTALYNVTVADTRPLTYSWTVNGTQAATTQSFTRNFNYTSAGYYVIMVNVTNDRLESSLFTWRTTVRNTNRAPVLSNALTSPLTVNGTVTFSDYFLVSGGQKYYDPDDDLNSNGQLDGAEANTLTFSTNYSCNVASISINGADLTVQGNTEGDCTVQFLATDAGGERLGSGNVIINITDIAEGSNETPTTSSGGGGGRSSPTFIPISKEQSKPKAFNLIAPRLVTIYSNKSVQIPISVNNTWKDTLKLVRLTAESNETGVNMTFDVDLFEEIPTNQSRDVMLTVTGYRVGGNYEIKVIGNVSDPRYEDSALILLNSIEQSRDGDDVQVKVTFANDLVNQHPECQELNEVLSIAKQRIGEGNLAEGEQLVDSVINGCKYLVSTQQRIEEKPSRLNPIINIDDVSVKSIMFGVLAFVVLTSIAFLVYYHYTHKPEDDI